jgi:hypothetical protein
MKNSYRPATRAIAWRIGNGTALTMLILALVTALAACGSDNDAASATTSSTTSTTAAPTTTTQPPTTSSTIPGAGEDVFGWLRSFEMRDAATTIVLVDQAEMLTGDEAVVAAREDGVIGADEDLPNDYYIRNPDESTTELMVSPEVVVTLQACYEEGECVTTEQIDLATWSILLGGEEDPGLDWGWYGQGSLPYVFTVANDLIVEIDEMYLP